MAGAGARDIKRRIKSVNSTKQITKAMELVSTAKLRRSKKTLEEIKPYYNKVLSTVQNILKNETNLDHVYLERREVKHTLYILITADRGLAGGYNINAIKEMAADITDKSAAKVITIGKYSKDYCKREGIEVVADYHHISEKPTYQDARAIATLALDLFKKEEVDSIKLIYTKLESTIVQLPKILELLPVALSDFEDVTTPEKEEPKKRLATINYEPSPEAVLSYLMPKYLETTIYGGLTESAASEQAARRVAMENASDNAEEMIEDLTLSFNQARQAAITQEISEIVGGATAFN